MTANILSRDDNFIPVMGAVSSLTDKTPRSLQYDPVNRGLNVNLVDITGENFNIQNPLPTDGDSVYIKDIDLDHSTKVGWTGNIADLFICPHDTVGMYNDSVTNPKVLYIPFCRTIYLSSVGLGCNLTGKTFSNTKIEFIGSDGSIRLLADYSTDSTKYGTKLYSFPPTACVAIKISFLTTETDVGLTNITIQKELPVVSRIRALKTDGTAVDIGASNNGSLNTNLRDEQTDKRTEVDALGQLKVVTSVNLVGTAFSGTTKDPNFWTESVTGSGAVSQTGKISLSTGVTANSTSKYVSVRKGRKIPGAANQFRTVCRLSTVPQANNIRRIGAYDANEGLFFQENGVTFGIGARKGGIDTIIASGSFNGNLGTTYDIDSILLRLVVDITEYSVKFFVNDILLHTLIGATDDLTNTLDLPITIENINSGGNTTNNIFDIRFASIQRLGDIKSANRSVYLSTNATTVLKYGAGTIQSINILDNAGTISLYDGSVATGRVLGVIDALKVTGDQDYPAQFDNYLTVVVAGNAKCTIFYE